MHFQQPEPKICGDSDPSEGHVDISWRKIYIDIEKYLDMNGEIAVENVHFDSD